MTCNRQVAFVRQDSSKSTVRIDNLMRGRTLRLVLAGVLARALSAEAGDRKTGLTPRDRLGLRVCLYL